MPQSTWNSRSESRRALARAFTIAWATDRGLWVPKAGRRRGQAASKASVQRSKQLSVSAFSSKTGTGHEFWLATIRSSSQ